MSMLRWLDMPFKYSTSEDFERKLTAWLSDVFYDRLPEQGFELRDEQIYTAFRIAKAFCHRQPLFAEAGSGTGKTFAYLLSALCYARMQGKPVILSSASTALQQQLTAPDGDIATLSRLLGLNIDARLAKDPRNHLCPIRVESLRYARPRKKGKAQLLRWAEQSKLGDRAEIPEVDDELWNLVAWNETLYCDRCRRRGYCQLARMRRHLWEAGDFVVSSHDIFFQDLWSREEREHTEKLQHFKAARQHEPRPYLPEYSAVVFDEGHLIEQPAISRLGRTLREQTVKDIIRGILAYSKMCRIELLISVELVEAQARHFFSRLRSCVVPHPEADRWHVNWQDGAERAAAELCRSIEQMQDHIAIETQLHMGTSLAEDLNAYIERFDHVASGLRMLCQTGHEIVTWWDNATDTLWILPDRFADMLRDRLLARRVSVVFTSATLSAQGSFAAMEQITGLADAAHSHVGTSFNLVKQVKAYLPADLPGSDRDEWFEASALRCMELIAANQGKALVLLNSQRELGRLKAFIEERGLPYHMLWEGSADRGHLVERFRKDISSVLFGTSFWEGMDVPGEALTLVIIFRLPYPWDDPVMAAKRRKAERDGLDPLQTVDRPAMLIKLRQGFGRLIRRKTDRGVLAVLDLGANGADAEAVREALPEGVRVYSEADRVFS